MPKLRIRVFVCMSILFAAVALFPNVANVKSLKTERLNPLRSSIGTTGILTADGTDPVPRPIPQTPLGMAS